MNLHHLRHFLAIVEKGSIRAAADALGLSQPAVSKGLRQIEKSLGVALIQRGPRGSSLTEVGKVVYTHAKLIESEVDRIIDDIEQLVGVDGGKVTMGLSATPSVLLLPAALRVFRQKNPKVTLDLVGGMPNVLLPRLVQGSIDLVVGPRPLEALPAQVGCLRLLESPSAIAVRQGHPLGSARSITDLADAHWVLNSSSIGIESSLYAAFKTKGLASPRIVVRADSLPAAYSLIAKSDYVGLMPRKVLEDSVMYNALQFVDVPEYSSTDSIDLYYRTEPRLSTQTLMLITALRNEAAKLSSGTIDATAADAFENLFAAY